MTPDTLRALIEGGETLDIEFKGEEHRPLHDHELVEAVVCLANRPGDTLGWLLIGVEDDGRVTGARPRHTVDTDLRRVQALIANRTRPALTTRVQVLPLDDKTVIAIEVPTTRIPIGTTDGRYLRRALGGRGEPVCLAFHYHEMLAYQADRGQLDYSALVVPEATWDDLDPLEFERFRRTIREGQGLGDLALLNLSNLELAKALGAVEANHEVRSVRVLGLLLFGKEEALRRLLPTHEVAFQVLDDTKVRVNDFFRWPLLRVMDEVLGRFRARVQEEELMIGMVRVGIPDYPGGAFREGVANALIHRDYTRLGAVHIQWHRSQLEISSPGAFPLGVRLDNLLVTAPQPRNPLLADAFKRAGLVERTARGIDLIFEAQLRTGRQPPSYDRSTESAVVLILPGGQPDLAFARLAAEERHAGHALELDDLLLLRALGRDQTVDLHTASRLVQKTEETSQATLNHLRQLGLAELDRPDGAPRYRLTAVARRRLNLPAGRLASGQFDARLAEEQIAAYLATHPQITRAEAAALCQISPDQAKRLLQRLVREGKLVQQQAGKATGYGLRPQNTGAPA